MFLRFHPPYDYAERIVISFRVCGGGGEGGGGGNRIAHYKRIWKYTGDVMKVLRLLMPRSSCDFAPSGIAFLRELNSSLLHNAWTG